MQRNREHPTNPIQSILSVLFSSNRMVKCAADGQKEFIYLFMYFFLSFQIVTSIQLFPSLVVTDVTAVFDSTDKNVRAPQMESNEMSRISVTISSSSDLSSPGGGRNRFRLPKNIISDIQLNTYLQRGVRSGEPRDLTFLSKKC